MPEIKQTFTGGRMNKDLDERLVKNGEYTNAMNVQVLSTDSGTDGDGQAGTIQNIKGNIKVGSSFSQSWMAELGTGQYSPLDSAGNIIDGSLSQYPQCVASVADEKNDKAYFFFASTLMPPNFGPINGYQRTYVDTIIEQDTTALGGSSPVVVDVWGIIERFGDLVMGGPLSADSGNNQSFTAGWSSIRVNTTESLASISTAKPRVGMQVVITTAANNIIVDTTIKAIDSSSSDGTIVLMLNEEQSSDLSGAKHISFYADRVLNFNASRENIGFFGGDSTSFIGQANFITGVNVIDGLIFWTDNKSEPKKINIKRCKAGTNIGSTNDLKTHTKLFVEHPTTGVLVDVATIDNELDNGTTGVAGSGINSNLQEKHITVIRKAPRTGPSIHMKETDRDVDLVKEIEIEDYSWVGPTQGQTLDFGKTKVIQSVSFLDSQFRKNDVLRFDTIGGIVIKSLKAKFICYEDAEGNEVLETTETIRVELLVSGSNVNADDTNWKVSVQEIKPLFETKLVRFGYRYRYADGEYSSFSPWSEVAFLPGKFDYNSKNGFNLGMTNSVRELIIKDFIPYKRPLDVVAIDILYKTTTSPNVYVVETIEKEKSSEWESFTPDGLETTIDIKTGQLSITSEMIHRVLPSSQGLRSWDNVPRYALAQEIVGNRLLYGNYTQGFDVGGPINISQSVKSNIVNTDGFAKKSLKSIRDYKVGLVYGDKYGRETPVITSGYTTFDSSDVGASSVTGDTVVPKSLSGFANSLVVSQKWGNSNVNVAPPEWIDYVKYYVKETSNEYYNLIMDRWYHADGDSLNSSSAVWLSFNSADRNKVDEETHLILKNAHGSSSPIVEDARYKILAIENEAPEFIKTKSISIGKINISDSITANSVFGETPYNTVSSDPIGLYSGDKVLTIFQDNWNASEIGDTDNDLGIFGRALEGELEIRIVGVNIDSDGVETASLTSEWRKVIHFSKGIDSNNLDCVSFKWSKHWSQTDVNMYNRFTSAATIGGSLFDPAQLKYHVEFKESVKKNKPEFDGKFFVKIQKDSLIVNNVAIFGAGVNTAWEPGDSIATSYIEDKSTNQHEMDSSPSGVDYGADFDGPGIPFTDSETWFNGAFQGVLGENDSADEFDNAGVNDESSVGNPLATYIDPVALSALESNPDLQFSPFGALDIDFNDRTKNFWELYEEDNNDNHDGNKVFIDAVSVASKHAANGPGQGAFQEGTFNINDTPELQGTKFNPFQKGFIAFDGSSEVGATNGTVGCIALSALGYNGDPQNYYTHDILDKFQEGKHFSFSENLNDPETNSPIIYKIIGIPHERTKSDKVQNYYPTPLNYIPGFNGDTEDLIPWGSTSLLPTQGAQRSPIFRQTKLVEFRRIDPVTGAVLGEGLDVSQFDPRAYLHHDGRDTTVISLMKLVSTSVDGESTGSENGACWETEPKEDVDLDLYYEASNSIPMVLNEENIFDFAPINSKVSIKRLLPLTAAPNTVATIAEINLSESLSSTNTKNHRVSNAHFPDKDKELAIISVVSDDANEQILTIDASFNEVVEDNPNFEKSFLHKENIAINDTIDFLHKDGTITSTKVKKYYEPINPPQGFISPLTDQDLEIGIVSGPKSFKEKTPSTPAPFNIFNQNDASLDGEVYEESSTQSASLGDLVHEVYFMYNGQQTPIDLNGFPVFVTSVASEQGDLIVYEFSIPPEQWLYPSLSSIGFGSFAINIFMSFLTPTGYYGVDVNVWENPVRLPWHNCYSFGNGVESDRIRDDFNAPKLDNGVKVSSTFSGYKEESIKSGLIYSGLYNSTSEVNDLNEFNMSEKITKSLNPIYGSIQALKTRDSNVVVLAEDKILKVLSNKDALFNADGKPQLTATDRVLGTAIPFSGDYGISKNPESLSSDQYRLYFTDMQRGAVLRLSKDGLTPISSIGMKSWFRENLKISNSVLGSFDIVSGEYNLTLNHANQSTSVVAQTVSFSEVSKGWVGFKSFIQENGISVSGSYFTTKAFDIYLHHSNSQDRNTFYKEYLSSNGKPFYHNSSVTVSFNDGPGVVKSFKYMNYEGSQAKVSKFTSSNAAYLTGNLNASNSEAIQGSDMFTDGQYHNLVSKDGWHVATMNTDLQQGRVPDFIKKEGKYFNYIKGTQTVTENIDTSEFTVQGVGQVGEIIYYNENAVLGCMNASAANYNPLATQDDGSCIMNIYGCTEPEAGNYNPQANVSDGSCYAWLVGCINIDASNYNPNATIDGAYTEENIITGSGNVVVGVETIFTEIENYTCIGLPGEGCTDPNFDNYDPDATISNPNMCTNEVDPIFGCTDPTACNYLPQGAAVTFMIDDGSCTYAEDTSTGVCFGQCPEGQITIDDVCVEGVLGCMDELACNYNPAANYVSTTLYNGENIACEYPIDLYGSDNVDCNGDLVPDFTTEIIFGCTQEFNAEASEPTFNYNYNPLATNDDGSCEAEYIGCMEYWVGNSTTCNEPNGLDCIQNINYNPLANTPCDDCCEGNTFETVYGCTDELASNYNPDATVNDFNCSYLVVDNEGCMDVSAINFSDSANVACVNCCTYTVLGCTDESMCNYNENANEDDGSCVGFNDQVYGCMNEADPNYDECATINNPNDCVDVVTFQEDDCGVPHESANGDVLDPSQWNQTCNGCMDENALNYDPEATTQVNYQPGCIPFVYGCMDVDASNYNPLANVGFEDLTPDIAMSIQVTTGVNIYATFPAGNPCIPHVYGCTQSISFNYDPNATQDDGSCYPIITGCMDETAFNFNNTNYYSGQDGSISYPLDTSSNQNFVNVNTQASGNPNSVNSEYACQDIIYGCLDPAATNYNPLANTNFDPNYNGTDPTQLGECAYQNLCLTVGVYTFDIDPYDANGDVNYVDPGNEFGDEADNATGSDTSEDDDSGGGGDTTESVELITCQHCDGNNVVLTEQFDAIEFPNCPSGWTPEQFFNGCF